MNGARDNQQGMGKLARVLADRMRAEGSYAPRELVLDIGVIQGNMSLLTNSFQVSIPMSDYHVCRHVAGLCLETSDGASVDLPKIKPGDRVLMAWVGNEAVVIDVIQKI